MSTFLEQGLGVIASAGFKRSSVGHARWKDIAGGYPSGTLKQFHYYPSLLNGKSLPPYSTTGAIVGEFSPKAPNTGTSAGTALDDPWPALGGADCIDNETATFERLRLLHKLGYPQAFIWPDQDKAVGVSKCSSGVHAGLKKFTAWSPP